MTDSREASGGLPRLPLRFGFDNRYAALPGVFYAAQPPTPVRDPRLLALNAALAAELGLDVDALRTHGAELFSGNVLPADAIPIACAYAGHQFGQFVPQLGDGRAILLGDLLDRHGRRRDIQLKGSGPTPFSRRGDGRAALGPVLREYLVSEAMHALGVPTTRALAAVLTGEPVFRDEVLPGAVITRVASSHIRVGTFEFFAARDDLTSLQRLLDHVLERHDPHLLAAENRALALLRAVVGRQAALVAQWMAVGFVHGVMNTDNCSIAGETIDYGPCAFMEAYDPATVFSSIDRHGRYAYANQAPIAQWNLARLAEALLPLIDPQQPRAVELATAVINDFQGIFGLHWQNRLGAKLGLWALPELADVGQQGPSQTPTDGAGSELLAAPDTAASDDDAQLMADWLNLLYVHRVDWTNAHRALCAAAEGDETGLCDLFADRAMLSAWLGRWQKRVLGAEGRSRESASGGTQGGSSFAAGGHEGREDGRAIAATMRRVNPAYIPRNHAVEAMIDAAEQGDMAPFQRLQRALASPFYEQPGMDDLARPAPADADPYRTFCGT